MQILHSGIDFMFVVHSQQFPKLRINESANKHNEATNMALAQNTYSASFGIAGRLSALISWAKDLREERKEYTKVYNELASLDDRELNELGLSRSMIRQIALEAAKAA